MKRFISSLTLLVIIMCCNAQTSDESKMVKRPNRIYLGLDLGYPPSVGGRITFMPVKDLGISFSIKRTSMIGSKIPLAFKKNAYGFKPGDVLLAYSLCFVKNFPARGKKSFPGIEFGLALVDYAVAKFNDKSFGSIGEGLLSLHPSNLYINYSHRYTLGLSYRFKINIPKKNLCGFELSLAGNLNKCRSYIGIEVSWLIGCFRIKN